MDLNADPQEVVNDKYLENVNCSVSIVIICLGSKTSIVFDKLVSNWPVYNTETLSA